MSTRIRTRRNGPYAGQRYPMYPPMYPPPYYGPAQPVPRSRPRPKKVVKKVVKKPEQEKFFAHPAKEVNWYVETRTADGRKFNINVLAFNKQHAITKTLQKFPKVTIVKLHPARIERLQRTVGRIRRGLSTAERIRRGITKFLDEPGPKYEPEPGTLFEDEESGSLI